MLECLIIGDSIGVGIHQFKQDCRAYAKGGWNTWQWNRDFYTRDLSANTVIISLGSNDHMGVRTRKELEKTRSKVQSKKVYWILPAIKSEIQDIVKEIAQKNGDIVLVISKLDKDGIHPSWDGYKELVKQIK